MTDNAKVERARALGLANRKHGQARPHYRGPTYRSWECMKSRCRNKSDPSYRDYGGRGISFHEPWNDFLVFLADMGERPRGMTLDRVDVNSDYAPGNCRWAPPTVQGRNKRNNRLVEYEGRLWPLIYVAEKTGIPYQRLHERIVRRGWTVEDAINKPPRGFR